MIKAIGGTTRLVASIRSADRIAKGGWSAPRIEAGPFIRRPV
jgi:hypothetical protein